MTAARAPDGPPGHRGKGGGEGRGRGARPDSAPRGFSEGARCGRRAGRAKEGAEGAWSTASQAAAARGRQLDRFWGLSVAEADACCIFAYFAGGSPIGVFEGVCCVRLDPTRDWCEPREVQMCLLTTPGPQISHRKGVPRGLAQSPASRPSALSGLTGQTPLVSALVD